MSIKTNVNAGFRFIADGSQTLPVLFGSVAGLAGLSAIGFCVIGLASLAWVPGVVAVVFGGLACVGWWKSHVNVDYQNAVPTTITDAKSGRTVVTDSRVLADPRKIASLGQALVAVASREPLALPDGIVGADGVPDPSRAKEAQAIVQASNANLQQQTSAVVKALGRLAHQTGVIQTAPAVTVVIEDEVLRLNVAAEIVTSEAKGEPKT